MHRRAGENEKKLYRSNNVMKTQTEELHNLKVLLKKNHHQNTVIYFKKLGLGMMVHRQSDLFGESMFSFPTHYLGWLQFDSRI